MIFGGNDNYPDHYFDTTRMTFGDHLEELRLHLWRAVAGFGVAMIFCFFLGKPVLEQVIIAPVESQLLEFYDRRYDRILQQNMEKKEEIAAGLKEKGEPQLMHVKIPLAQARGLVNGDVPEVNPAEVPGDQWVTVVMQYQPLEVSPAIAPVLQKLGPRPSMKTFNVTEAFIVYFKVSLACGFVIASPWIFWQIWAFVAAGLYPHEKRYVYVYLPFSLGLFLVGALACQFVVLPRAVSALLWFNEWLSLDPDLRLNEWLGFAIMMPIVFGLSFQTPLVMLFLFKIGIMDVATYQSKRKIAFFVMAIVAALFTPSIDAVSMLFLWIPLCGLYQLGIWLCQWSGRSEAEMLEDDSQSDELIGV